MTRQQAEQIKTEIRQILDGIDAVETQYEHGWWETGAGADFGEKKLDDVLAVIDRQVVG